MFSSNLLVNHCRVNTKWTLADPSGVRPLPPSSFFLIGQILLIVFSYFTKANFSWTSSLKKTQDDDKNIC